ncbi:MAG: zinc ribbon domain-containing protein [Candidatus Odinarchaeum yellowstonii]|uniref:Zinc ribbon domain-containing protein n=1 Tax=Odinarchaeota yellowstonii (strain LCB_4) TaxID=1841599 RepID=A0AAF0IB75_ODILC|nr:MAG: zinc ribbon domain-containing protein [Candidatus Odinarchaeum yellowstonii]
MVKETLSEWPLDEKLSDTVLDFLIKYPRVLDERVVLYWDNFILTNYRLYYKNSDGKIYLIPHYKIKEYIYKEGGKKLILKLRDKTTLELTGPIPKPQILKKTYSLSDWRKLSKKEDELLEKTNIELGRPVREKPRRVIEQPSITSEPSFSIPANNHKIQTSFDRIPFDIKTNSLLDKTGGIFCPHCGFKITLEGARFCPNCGVDLI